MYVLTTGNPQRTVEACVAEELTEMDELDPWTRGRETEGVAGVSGGHVIIHNAAKSSYQAFDTSCVVMSWPCLCFSDVPKSKFWYSVNFPFLVIFNWD